MELIPQWRTSWKFWSSLTAIVVGFLNAAVAANFFGLLDKLGPQGLALANAVVVGLAIPTLRALQQEIPATTEQKVALVEKAVETPLKKGQAEPDILVTAVQPPRPTVD